MGARRPHALAAALLAVLAVVVLPSTATAGTRKPGPAKYDIGKRLNVPVTMSDGTILRADVYFPTDRDSGKAADGRFPVILTQTPYGKGSGASSAAPGGDQLSGLSGYSPYLVEHGYIDVLADVRGTGASQGSWGLFDPEQGRDGAELVRWAARLPNADGKVGTLGASYLGIIQFLTAENLGPHSPLKAMFPIITANDIYRDTAFDGGILDIEFGGFYLGLTAGLNLVNPLLESFTEQPSNPDLLETLAQHIGGLLAYHAATLANMETGGDQGYDEAYWQSRNPRRILDTVVDHHIPTFLVGGWFDLFQRGEPLNFAGLQNLWAGRGAGKPMRPGQDVTGRYQLMMGPWYHVTAGEGIDLDRIELAWFDRWLKGEDTGIDRTRTPLHLYQLGSDKWLDASRYPLDQARPRTYYLGDGGALSTSKPPDAGGSDTVAFTGPSSPCGRATEQWGAGLLQLLLEGAGGTDPCAEDDSTTQIGPGTVSYTTAPFRSRRVLAGPIDATLFAKSTRPDTEFVVTLEDVAPDGGSTPLTSGALLGSFRKVDDSASWSADNGKPLLPYHPYTRASSEPVPTGKTTRFDVEVFPTFAELAKGHRLRVTIATSEVPHLMPSTAQAAQLAGGVYDIQHNARASSFVVLPLAPAGDFRNACTICR